MKKWLTVRQQKVFKVAKRASEMLETAEGFMHYHSADEGGTETCIFRSEIANANEILQPQVNSVCSTTRTILPEENRLKSP